MKPGAVTPTAAQWSIWAITGRSNIATRSSPTTSTVAQINNDLLKRAGSGYKASHGKDLLRSQDSWFMGVTLKYGPDGGVFVIDWSDTGECHSVGPNAQHETGRIFCKITFGDLRSAPIDFAKLTTEELVAKQLHRNDWHVRQARRLLQRYNGADMAAASAELRKQFDSQEEIPRKLRALWALYTMALPTNRFWPLDCGIPANISAPGRCGCCAKAASSHQPFTTNFWSGRRKILRRSFACTSPVACNDFH